MKRSIDYTLYLVTDSRLCPINELPKAVERAILGGVTVVQIREKEASTLDFYNIAIKVKEVADKHNVPIIINDRLDIALAIDAAGLHIGQDDLPAKTARKLLGDGKILGVSAGTMEEAVKAKNNRADYIGVGAVFPTNTKEVADYTGVDLPSKIRKELNMPVVAIGGINKSNAGMFYGIDGIAVVSAIMGTADEEKEARELKKLFTLSV